MTAVLRPRWPDAVHRPNVSASIFLGPKQAVLPIGLQPASPVALSDDFIGLYRIFAMASVPNPRGVLLARNWLTPDAMSESPPI